MYKLYNKIISIIIALSFLYSNSLWALAPDAKLDEVKYARVLAALFQALSGQRGPNVSLPQGLELSLVPKDRVLYLYSKNPRTSPGVIYRVYISGRSPAPVPSRPIHTEDIGKLRIEVYPRTPYWDERIGTRTDALTDEEAALLQEFIDSTDEQLVRELLQRLVPQPLGSILEVNARAWEKRFKDIDDEALREIKRKGYDTIWLMGVWEISPESTRINRGRGDNFAGSAYAIMDYRINPELGTEEDFAEFSRRAKELGVRVIVDFVSNHMAKDSPWIDTHPEWFMPHWGEVSAEDRAKRSYHGTPWFFQHPSGRMIAHGALSWDQRDDPWIDTSQLNLANAELRRHLIETLKRIARLTQSGGVRCDIAMLATKIHIKGMWFRSTPQAEFDRLMSQEFWLEVINEVRKEFPDFKFIAEGYWGQEGYLQGLGFDATYDKHVYDLLARGDIRGLKGYLNSVPKDYLARTVHFLANHDERDLLGRLRDVKQQEAAVVIQGVIPGYLLYYLDQVEGRDRFSSANYIPRITDVKADVEVKRLYSRLVPVFSQPVFRRGGFRLIQTTGERTDNVFACQRQYKDEIAVTVVNYSDEAVTVTLEPSDLDLEKEYLWSDPITGDKRLVKGKDIRGYRLDLIPWGFHIFTLVPAANLPEGEVRALRDRGLTGVKIRGPPEDQSFFGYTNDVPNVAMGTVLKVEVSKRDFSPELKKDARPARNKKSEIAHLRYVMDYIVISYYARKKSEAMARGEGDKAEVYNAYILILKDIKGKIVRQIKKKNRTAIALLLEYYETEIKPAKERAVDDKARGMWEEIEFLIMEVVEHLQEKIFTPLEARPLTGLTEQVMSEIEFFNTALGETKREFEGQDGIITSLYTRLLAEVPSLIRDKKFRAGRAIFEIVEQMELAGSEGDVIKRFIDRLMERLEIGEGASVEGDVILVCNNVPHPIKVEKLRESLGDKARIKAIVCNKGTPLSHFSIFAAQEGIAAITGAHDNRGRGMFEQVKDGEMLVVYGFNGKIIRNPSHATLTQLPQLILEERAFHEYIKGNADKDAVTAQGVNIKVLGNADRPHQIKEVMESGGNGIGLVRTEYLYDRSTLPTVEELIDKFKVLAIRCEKGEGIVIRLFDKQPDKKMPCLAESQWSGFQYYTKDEAGRQAVRDELKAVYLAFLEYPNIRVMFPQVSTPADVDFAMRLINEVKQEIVSEGKADREKLDRMEIGFMVETPAAVSNIEYLLRHADFVSIGTNDLTELAFKVDRDDEASADYFLKLQPVILKYIQDVLTAVRKVNSGLPAGKKKKVSICGDLARYRKFLVFILAVSDGDIQLSPSMPPRFIPLAKELIRSLDIEECRRIFKGPIDETVDEKAQELIDRTMEKIKGRDDYRRTTERLLQAELASQGALIGKVVDENGEIITEYITGAVKGRHLILRDSRHPEKKAVARIRCDKEYVKEGMIKRLIDLLSEANLPPDSIERRYIQAIIEDTMSEAVGFYVLKEDVRNIYGFANDKIFCLYEPFLGIPAAFFHEAGESFFLSNSYRALLSQETGHALTDEEWLGYKGKARVVVDGEERLIPAHTYLRGLGKKARTRERELTEAERLLPNTKGLEDLLFGEENVTVSTMIREQKEITRALRELEELDWVRVLVPELKKFTKFFPDKSEDDILRFIRELIQTQSVSKLLDLLLDRLLRPNRGNPNTNIDLLQCVSELENLLNLLYQHVPYVKIKQIIEVTREKLERPKDAASLEEWRKNIFVMKALVRFFRRIEKAELHYHLDGALSPDLILKILCLFPEARERFVRTILGRPAGSVNEIFSSEIGGPRNEEGWELLQYSLQYLFHGRVSGESDFISRFGGMREYRKAIRAISRYLEYRPTEIGTTNINEFLKKFGLTGLALYCNPEALRILSREATLETYRRDNTTLIEQKMHNLTFGYPLFTVIQKVLQGLREAESISRDKIRTALTLCIFKNPDLVLGERYGEVVKASEADTRSIEAIRYSIWQETEIMLRNDFGSDQSYAELEKKELDEAIAELRRMAKTEEEARKRLLIFWEERKEGIRQIREIIRAKQQLALDYPELAKKLVAIDTVGSEIGYITWVHSYGLRLARRYGFRIIDHAGESWPEEDIWQALNRVKGAIETGAVERIGHATCLGIHPEALRESRFSDGRLMYTLGELREIERAQQRLLGMMRERNIVLETNPSSNLLLLPRYITTYSRHPIQYFWRRLEHLLVASSDDPHILHTIGLSGELSKVWLAHPNFKFGELLQIIRNGFQHTFLNDVHGVQGPASHIPLPLWDGVIPEEEAVDLKGYHPSSIVNRVRGYREWLPVLDYQRIGEYPQDLIELEQSLTLHAVGWEKTISGEYGSFATPAGMPAINIMLDAAMERKGLGMDAEIILIEPPYGCTKNLMDRLQRTGYRVHSITVDQVEEKLPGLINDKTGIIYLESVANPNLMVPSIEFILRENHGRAAVLVDDTFATPEMIRSLEIEVDGYSVDMSMIGLTKGATGTGNIISGAVVAKKEWHELLAKHRNCLPEEQEIKRAKRGIRHMAIRFKAQSRNAGDLTSEIERSSLVGDMVYPKNGHMLYYVYKKLCNAIDNINLLAKFRTMINAVSLGQVRNLFERPSGGTHFTVGEEARKKGGISAAGVRGSIGIETKEDVLKEIKAMLEIIGIYGDEIPKEDMDDINRIFMAEYVTQEEDRRTVRYLLPKWPIPHQTFERLISDLADGEKGRLRDKYSKDGRFRRVVDLLIKATEITEYDPVNIAIHHRLIWCLLSGDHNSVIASPIESTTTHKAGDGHMEDTFGSILAGKRKGLPPIGNFTLYSRLGKPGIASLELLMTLLEAGAEKALNYDYIATSFYTERMAQLAFLGQQTEIVIMNAMMERSEKTAEQIEEMRQKQYDDYLRLQDEVLSEIRKKELEIIIVTPNGTVLEEEARMAESHGIVRFRIIHPEDIEKEVSDKTIMVYFDNLRIRGYDPVKIRDIVKGKNPKCTFGITDSFNLGYENPRTSRDFDFITHVIYYENADKGAVIIAKNDKPLTAVWNNPFWSRKNRGTAMSEDNAVEALWYVLPYLRVFDERYDVNINTVTGVLNEVVKVKRIDKRNLELEFKTEEEKERFLALAWDTNLIDASNFPLPAYFSVNEWTSLRPKDKDSNSLILQIGIEETNDLVKDFNAIISRFKDSGAIGKGSSLAEKDSVPVENLNDKENEAIREAIDRIREAISRAGLTHAEVHMAGEALALLERYVAAGNIKVFDARVRDPEDYLLAFPRERDHVIALARDLLDPDYIIQFYHILPEILFHEGFTARFGERDYEEHRRIYQGIQRKIFGKDNEVAETLRYYINLKLPGTYEIEFDQKTLNDRNINLDRIGGLLRDKEFVYRTLMGLYGNYKFMFPHIRIGRMKVEYGGTGSQKQTLHVSFNDENTGWKLEFAFKAAINRSAREGFAKGERNEIPTLREISGRCNIPRFGIYYEEPGNNFYVYTEEWVHGPTAARVIARGRLTKEKLTNIVKAYLSVMKALDKRSKAGGYLGIYDVQTENVMFESWEADNAVTVDIGKIDYIKPLFILQEFDRHYSKGDPELQKAIFDGVIEVFGLNKGLEFLGEALDASSLDRREVKGFTREMALRLAGSLSEYLRDVYIEGIANQISRRLSGLAYKLLGAFLEKTDPGPIMEEARLWFKKLYEDTRDAYENDMGLSNKIILEVVELVLQSISIEDINLPPSLDSIERLLDVSFLLGFVAMEDIRYKQREDGRRVIDILSYRPELHKQAREEHTYPPKGMLDALELGPNDVYLNLGGGPGINNVAACLRGVRGSIYLDISEGNLAFVARLKKYYEDIRNNPELRGRLENRDVNVIDFITEIMRSHGETIDLDSELTMDEMYDNPNLWFGEETLPQDALDSPNPPLKVHLADAASMPLEDDSVTKVSVLGLFRWVKAQGGIGKVIHTMREVLRVTREGGLILYRADNPEEDEYITHFPHVAAAMSVIIWLKRITPLKEDIFEVVSKSGDLYGGVAGVVNREMGLSLSSEELREIMDTASQEDLVEAFRLDNGAVDEGDLRMTKRVTEIIRGFNVSRKTKLRLIKAIIILIRKDRLKGRIRQHISYYGMLSERVKYGEVKNVFIDKECLPRDQQYILEGAEWERRRQLLESMFPGSGYRFGVFSGNLEADMNRNNTIVLTNKKMDIDARLVFITNAGEEEYFPIDGLMFLGVGLLNLSPADRSGSPLASTITRLYKEITGQDIDIPRFVENENYRLDIILPPIGRFNTEVQTYAITLLEQAA